MSPSLCRARRHVFGISLRKRLKVKTMKFVFGNGYVHATFHLKFDPSLVALVEISWRTTGSAEPAKTRKSDKLLFMVNYNPIENETKQNQRKKYCFMKMVNYGF